MSLVYWQGKPLFVGGKIAFSLACCCNACARTCIVVRLSINSPSTSGGTEPWEPDIGTGPPQPSMTSMDASLVWHAHSWDTISTNPPRSGYHTHVWLLEVKYNQFMGPTGVPPLDPIQRYLSELDDWVNGVVAASGGSTWGSFNNEQVLNGPCLSTFPAEELARPPLDLGGVTYDPITETENWDYEIVFGPVTQTAFPECTAV